MKYYAERETLFCLANVKCIEQAAERKLKKKNIYYVYTIGFKKHFTRNNLFMKRNSIFIVADLKKITIRRFKGKKEFLFKYK